MTLQTLGVPNQKIFYKHNKHCIIVEYSHVSGGPHLRKSIGPHMSSLGPGVMPSEKCFDDENCFPTACLVKSRPDICYFRSDNPK